MSARGLCHIAIRLCQKTCLLKEMYVCHKEFGDNVLGIAVLGGLTNSEQLVTPEKYKDAAVLKKIRQGVWDQSVDEWI